MVVEEIKLAWIILSKDILQVLWACKDGICKNKGGETKSVTMVVMLLT